MAGKFNFGASLSAGSFYFPMRLLFPLHQQVLMGTLDDGTDVNMAADCRVESLYDLAAFTTVRNCDVFKSEFRSLPNAVQCDIYRTVSMSMFSVTSCSWFSSIFGGNVRWTLLMFTKLVLRLCTLRLSFM